METRNEMLDCLLALSHTPRWCTHYVSRQQWVDGHSYRVAVLAMAMRDGLSEVTRQLIREGVLLRYALVHDGPEAKTGDIPAPLKQMIGHARVAAIELESCPWIDAEDAQPNVAERMLVNIADAMEALSWIRTYGHGARDRFDNQIIEDKLRHRVHDMAAQFATIVGDEGFAVIHGILGQVAP